MNYRSDQGGQKANPLKEVCFWLRWSQCYLFVESAEQPLCMGNVANAVDVGVFHLRRSLRCSQISQVRHELLDEAFEEGHHDQEAHGRAAADEEAYFSQVAIHGLRIGIGWNGVGGEGEASHHLGMCVAHFFCEVIDDDLARLFRLDGKKGARHPVDKITFQDGCVSSDDPTPLVGRHFLRV